MFKPKHPISLCSEARHSTAPPQIRLYPRKVVGKSGSLVVILTFLVFQETWSHLCKTVGSSSGTALLAQTAWSAMRLSVLQAFAPHHCAEAITCLPTEG